MLLPVIPIGTAKHSTIIDHIDQLTEKLWGICSTFPLFTPLALRSLYLPLFTVSGSCDLEREPPTGWPSE